MLKAGVAISQLLIFLDRDCFASLAKTAKTLFQQTPNQFLKKADEVFYEKTSE
jgi:hypothetical protein